MTNTEILQKAIEKAVGNGFKIKIDGYIELHLFDWVNENFEQYKNLLGTVGLKDVIFNHSFAKAFWGENQITTADLSRSNNKKFIGSMALGISWKYHLQQMVLEEDPIHYFEKFLD